MKMNVPAVIRNPRFRVFNKFPELKTLDRKLIASSIKNNIAWGFVDFEFDVEKYLDCDVYYDYEGMKIYCIPVSLFHQRNIFDCYVDEIDEYILSPKAMDTILQLASKTEKKIAAIERENKKIIKYFNQYNKDIIYG